MALVAAAFSMSLSIGLPDFIRRRPCYNPRVTDDEIDQLRHDTANAAQKLSAARAMVLRALAAVELKDDTEAKRILRDLLSGLERMAD